MSEVSKRTIYALVDPRDESVFYVGRSANTKRRLSQHLSDRRETEKVRRIQSLRVEGLTPTLRPLEVVDESDKEAEAKWMVHYGLPVTVPNAGRPLANAETALRVAIAVRVPVEVAVALDEMAFARGISRTELVREIYERAAAEPL